jgi:hypothetical protein
MSRGYIIIPFFILIALSILFFSHYFVYFSLCHFFGIAAPARRATLAGILILLPTSFIASSILAHWTEDFFSRAFYFCSALWLGVGLTRVQQILPSSVGRLWRWPACTPLTVYGTPIIPVPGTLPSGSRTCRPLGEAEKSCSFPTCIWGPSCAQVSPPGWWRWSMPKALT